MGRSSRYILCIVAVGLFPPITEAQVYGFPGAVGVIDDGFGTLPPAGLPFPASPAPGFGLPNAGRYDAGTGEPSPQPHCALIIQVGKGLRHKATTRVVYGHAAPCH